LGGGRKALPAPLPCRRGLKKHASPVRGRLGGGRKALPHPSLTGGA